MAAAKCLPLPVMPTLGLARVLLVDDDPASRLTLQTVLQASGYFVDTAASAAEAIGKMDLKEYALILSDLHMESRDAGLRVLAHARSMEYRPASAILSTWQQDHLERSNQSGAMLIETEDIPELLGQVAGMISARARRLAARSIRSRN